MSKRDGWGLLSLKPTWQKAVLGVGLFLLLRKKDEPKAKAPGSPEGTELDEGVAGPLTIHIDHLDGADTVYERSGPPSIWGDGLTHQDIEGTDDDPQWVGEAKGPVTPPSGGGSFLTPTTIGLGLGALLLGAAVFMPGESHASKDARSNPRRRRRNPIRRRRRSEAWYRKHESPEALARGDAWAKRKYGADYVEGRAKRRRRRRRN